MEKYTKLGGTGLFVTRLCLGTMTFGIQADEQQSRAIMDLAYDAGVRFFDTADAYPLGSEYDLKGRTEEIVGRWLKGRRHEIVLATKVFGAMGPSPNDGGLARRHILSAVDASLSRLQTDVIDLYQAHQWDPNTPLDEILEAFDRVVEAGKVRYIGVSNWRPWQLALAVERARGRHWARFVSEQSRYNLLFRMVEDDILPLCQDQGIGFMAYNPLAGGLLSGRYRPGQDVQEGTRFALPNAGSNYQNRYWHDAHFAAVESYTSFCRERGYDPVTTAIAWVIHQEGVTSAILGASKPAQLESSLKAWDMTLSSDDRAALDQLWWNLPRRFEYR